MDRIRHRLLYLLRQRLLQRDRHLTVPRRVAHLAGVLVTVGVVNGLSGVSVFNIEIHACLYLEAYARALRVLSLGPCLGR